MTLVSSFVEISDNLFFALQSILDPFLSVLFSHYWCFSTDSTHTHSTHLHLSSANTWCCSKHLIIALLPIYQLEFVEFHIVFLFLYKRIFLDDLFI